ncbi:hypothetical protein B0I35DRAFT_500940 [Stachybotrys elegans]|uniref:SGNH hydrolase-type esterase domain-containing protein n=1 Tax=Stachybotrys elegans TaxID=80388 RepID=A0A8K0SRJ7_9HYPO|nr:hypothetical protein B0I35DRAFT_500940 [Stachybotrys elegans]
MAMDDLRKALRDALRSNGWEVNMVGSLYSGTMKDWNHEAVPGDIIDEVLRRIPNAVPYKPNVVIINAGTNDANGNVSPSEAGVRMGKVLDALWGAQDMANTCIMLSTLIPTTHSTGVKTRPVINDAYRELVKQRASAGKCIYLAEMAPGGSDWLVIPDDYSSAETTHIHPNDAGHRKMAAVFYKAIMEAAAANKLVVPQPFSAGPTVCDKFAGSGTDAGGLTQRGYGHDDGIYIHSSQQMPVSWTWDSDWDRDQWRFARLFSQNYDDLVAWVNLTETDHVFSLWKNSGDGKGTFTRIADLIPDLYCNPRGIHFIDMTGDGLDDLVCIDPEGNAYLSVNQADGNRAASKPPTFKRVSSTALIKTNEGYKQERVVLGDIDGDGRGDYGIIDDGGNVHFWRNGWVDPIPKYWQALGQRFAAKGMGDIRGVRFEDINGDGRDDWLWVGTVGQTTTYTNARSCAIGRDGNGLNVAWRQGFLKGTTSGPTHLGVGSYMTDDESYLRNRIHFARIYGETPVFGNLPKQDYVFMQHEELSNGKHRFTMRVWKNTGVGGTKLLADGDKFCNMAGHTDGREDYVWTWSNGRMELFINRGKKSISDSDPGGFWDPSAGTIWTPPRDMDRRDLHLADWDGDGDCDIIHVNPNGGGVEVFLNEYPQKGSWQWTHLTDPAPGLSCSQKRGLGIYDLAVRFADLTGNGRADYMCLEPDGRVTGFLHNSDNSFTNVGQIKFSEDKDRANLRWADVNADGVDDMLWIDKLSGDTYVWYNEGRGAPGSEGGSSFHWRRQAERAYDGLAAGTCVNYADLDGNGVADEHFLLGTFNNEARTSFAPSCGIHDETGDDAVMGPALPPVPGQGGGGGGGGGGNTGHQVEGGGCGYNFGSKDFEVLKNTWALSGASGFLGEFLQENGAENWDYNFFSSVLNGGTGGSTYDCNHVHSGNCPGPLSTPCEDYTPDEAFYVHVSIGLLYSSYSQIWAGLVEDGIGNLASNIKDVVEAYGTPPEDANSDILNMLLSILTSLVGISEFIGEKFPGRPTAELFGKASTPLGIFTEIIGGIAGDPEELDGYVDPDDLNDELEKVYGKMFTGLIKGMGDAVEGIFNGKKPDGWTGSAEEYVESVFQDGRYLSKEIVDGMAEAYVENTQAKFIEFATIKAMQSENRKKYFFLYGSVCPPIYHFSFPAGFIVGANLGRYRPKTFCATKRITAELDLVAPNLSTRTYASV